MLLRTLVRRRADGVVEMISFDALKSRRSPIGEVLHQVVHGCSSRCTMCHHCSPPFVACESKSIGSDKPNETGLSTKDATSIVGCSSCFHAGKRSEGKVSLPPCSLTIGYYRYALTLCIAKPETAYAWHSELNTSLGTTTRNQPNRFGQPHRQIHHRNHSRRACLARTLSPRQSHLDPVVRVHSQS